MGERTQYSPGTFSWTDLTTTDQEAAKAFYAGLFGWEYDDRPAGEDVVCSMATLDGKMIAGLSPQPQQQRDAGVPPLWNSYVTVEDADQTLARARELGATVHADAFDVFDAGRTAVVQDPQGAYFLLWQPNQHIGAGLVNAPGALSWNELGSPDLEGSAAFYEQLLGWKTTPMEGADPPYLVIQTADGHSNGGIRPPAPPARPPSGWSTSRPATSRPPWPRRLSSAARCSSGPPTSESPGSPWCWTHRVGCSRFTTGSSNPRVARSSPATAERARQIRHTRARA